jgi:hypothetical protein
VLPLLDAGACAMLWERGRAAVHLFRRLAGRAIAVRGRNDCVGLSVAATQHFAMTLRYKIIALGPVVADIACY